ncbi:hypothetical protein HPP92_028367 [Vanilla planifolia]|uniref:Transmembrane protein n=1 Tax=Vanilla planifolia TaxID=51239 RepID=A0A835U5Z9_VANPL|nr:hypothetical protein HPP92_028367 [Vanilla planifolia]
MFSMSWGSSFALPSAPSRAPSPQRSFFISPNANPLYGAGEGMRNRGSRHVRVPTTSTRVIDGANSGDFAHVEISWQIFVGALAGVTPFIVAGIEFGKRIVTQRNCGTCGGSGLVHSDQSYVRCPTCGGFLPWQSWKRFFTG